MFFSVKEGFCQIRGSWVFTVCSLLLDLYYDSRCYLHSGGFPDESVCCFHTLQVPLAPPHFGRPRIDILFGKMRVLCPISFPRGGCVCSWLRVSAELGSATAKHGKACLQPYGAKADSIESVCSICLLHQGTPARQNKLRKAKTN